MQRSGRIVQQSRNTVVETGAAVSGDPHVLGNSNTNQGNDCDEDESISSEEEDQIVYLEGMRVSRTSHSPLASELETDTYDDNDGDSDSDGCLTLEEIRDRYGEELHAQYDEMLDEAILAAKYDSLAPPDKTYIGYLRKRGRLYY